MIQTQRLIIRHFRAEDFSGLFDYLSNPEVYRFEPGDSITLEEAKTLAAQRAESSEFWAVALKETDKIIGHLYFHQIEPQALNGTNGLEIRVYGNEKRGQAVLVARYDNLGKGASGAAVQNLGLMLGIPVNADLPVAAPRAAE